MPRICVIGSANVDHTLALPRLPHPGETVSGGMLLTNLGGKGANQAVAARKLGAEVRMLGAVGEDGPGREIRERLDALGIDVTGIVPVAGAATGTALIFVDAEGRNQIGVAPGANHRLTVEMLRPYEGAIAWADVVVCQLETPLPVVRWALEEAHRLGVRAILNPAPVRELPDDLLGLVAYLTPNAGEAAALAGLPVGDMDSAREAGRRLLERGAATVIVTLGGEGALVCQRDRIVHFPAFPVAVVDTTAAGDAFNGALAVGLAAGGTLEEAVPLAGAAAALTCTRRGAQDSLPERAEVERFLRALRAGQGPPEGTP
ncbi:MAG: ribokinase [Candidatus Rokubacteria bacterium GWC2_70_24]|nr:MAG: ribokinase [Candidatus Rokubacteria bacterium GWC2_70_24]